MPGDAEDVHAPGPQVDREQDVQRPEPDRLDGEEVKGQNCLGLRTKNSRQVGPSRRGAGPSPFFRSSKRILVAETRIPSLASSPRILMQPHLGFSLPIRRMSCRTSSGIGACRRPTSAGRSTCSARAPGAIEGASSG